MIVITFMAMIYDNGTCQNANRIFSNCVGNTT